MNKVYKRKINFKRKDNINRGLLIQIIISIVLVVAVLVTKKINQDMTNKYLDIAKAKFEDTINYRNIIPNIKNNFSSVKNTLTSKLFYKDEYVAPVNGKVVMEYNKKDESDEISKYKNGIDILSNLSSVKSMTGGVVTNVGSNENLGNFIIITKDKSVVIYSNLEEVFVVEKDKIELGQLIGKLDETNKLLHLEVWNDGKQVNPTKLFNLHE